MNTIKKIYYKLILRFMRVFVHPLQALKLERYKREFLERLLTKFEFITYAHSTNYGYNFLLFLKKHLRISQDNILFQIYGFLNILYFSRTCRRNLKKLTATSLSKKNNASIDKIKLNRFFTAQPSVILSSWNKTKVSQDFFYSDEQRDKLLNKSHTPIKITFVSQDNWNFMEGIILYFDSNPQFHIETVQLNRYPHIFMHNAPRLFFPSSSQDRDFYFNKIIKQYLPLEPLSKADVVFVDWCNAAAVWMSHYLPKNKKLIIRLHSYEAFSHWIHFINWSRVDQIIFIAEHIKEFVDEQINLKQFRNLKVDVVKNFNDLSIYNHPKSTDANKRLGLIGYNNKNKNPLLAVQLLSKLVAHDPSWKLVLVGHEIKNDRFLQKHEKKYHETLSYLTQKLSDNIEYRPFTNHIQNELQKIGFILSTSDREGSHEAVVQGMASGCIPIVRRWPLCEKWQASRKAFPHAIEFDETSLDTLAQKIMNLSHADEFKRQSMYYQNLAFSEYDKDKTIQGLERTIFDH